MRHVFQEVKLLEKKSEKIHRASRTILLGVSPIRQLFSAGRTEVLWLLVFKISSEQKRKSKMTLVYRRKANFDWRASFLSHLFIHIYELYLTNRCSIN